MFEDRFMRTKWKQAEEELAEALQARFMDNV